MAKAVTKTLGTASTEKRWFQEFGQVAKHGKAYIRQAYWDGAFVYSELKRSRITWVIDPEDDLHMFFEFLVKKLNRELFVYRCHCSEVARRNQEFNDLLAKLQGAINRLSERGIHFPESKAVLMENRKYLQSQIRRLRKTRDTFWTDRLHDYGEDRPLMFEGETLKPIPMEDEQAHEKLFEAARYTDKLVRDVDLDRRFQVRLAVIFRHYLRRREGVSLSTIGKLIILYYICTGLACERDDGALIVKGTNRNLTIGSVVQRLGHCGMR